MVGFEPIVYITPIDVEAGERHNGRAFTEQVAANVAVIQEVLAEEGLQVLDFSRALKSDRFCKVDKKRTFEVSVEKTGNLPTSVRSDIVELCNAAFPDPYDKLFGFLPRDAIHVLGRLEGQLISHAVVTSRQFRIGSLPEVRAAYVDAVATLPAMQRRGYGARVMKCLARAVASDFDIAALATFIPAWYAALGWEEWEGPLALMTEQGTKPTPDENATVMIHRLPNTPPLDLRACLVANWRPGGGW